MTDPTIIRATVGPPTLIPPQATRPKLFGFVFWDKHYEFWDYAGPFIDQTAAEDQSRRFSGSAVFIVPGEGEEPTP